MYRIFILNLLLLSFTLVACDNKHQKDKTDNLQKAKEEINYLTLTPDSILTVDLRNKKNDLKKLIIEKLKIENNKFVTTATTTDFEKLVFSKEYYIILIKDIDQVNSMYSFNSADIQKAYEELIESLQ